MNVLLAIAGPLLRGVNAARRALYRAGALRGRKLPRPVISVGNVAAGGAGKTPAVIAIARYLGERKIKVAVLTRGYGRAKGAPDGLLTELDPARFGDEPVIIKKAAPNVDVIVGAKRYFNASLYLTMNSCDCFLLDDGFQHLQIQRDLDIVIDTPDARLYREGRSALRDASIVIPRHLEVNVPESLRGKRVFAFAGLASNEQFFDSLRGDLTVAGTLGFPDHHIYTGSDLARIDSMAAAAGAEAIVTTEKDKVKIERRDIIAIPATFVMEPAVLERIEAAIRK